MQTGENECLRGYGVTLEPWPCPAGQANPRSAAVDKGELSQ
jgi:hypothetical protein